MTGQNRIREIKSPFAIKPFPAAKGFEVSPGERHDLVTVIQIMLCSLKVYYDSLGPLTPCGSFDAATEDAVRTFQRKAGLPETGKVDLETWNRIAEEFNASIYENH